MSHILDQPDIEGPAGRVWFCEEKTEEAEQNLTSELEIILVEQEGGDTEPTHKVLALRHLRESDLLGPPSITKPGATHELWVMDVNPDTENNIVPHDISTFHPMFPPIFEQFIAPSDSAAKQKIAETAAGLVIQKIIDLKTNSREDWDRLIAEQNGDMVH
jgi:hypothetical protein